MCMYVYLLDSQVEEAAEIELKEQLMKSEEERRKLTMQCAIYQSQLEVRLCNMYAYAVLHTTYVSTELLVAIWSVAHNPSMGLL